MMARVQASIFVSASPSTAPPRRATSRGSTSIRRSADTFPSCPHSSRQCLRSCRNCRNRSESVREPCLCCWLRAPFERPPIPTRSQRQTSLESALSVGTLDIAPCDPPFHPASASGSHILGNRTRSASNTPKHRGPRDTRRREQGVALFRHLLGIVAGTARTCTLLTDATSPSILASFGNGEP